MRTKGEGLIKPPSDKATTEVTMRDNEDVARVFALLIVLPMVFANLREVELANVCKCLLD